MNDIKPDFHSHISLVSVEIFSDEKCSNIVCCIPVVLNDPQVSLRRGKTLEFNFFF